MKGKVWLVGAGPGDAGLLTVKGKAVLKAAQVVVYDALVGDGILSLLPKDAEVIYAGKQAAHHTLKQEEINQILLTKALAGKRVVRLKGGDPFLFGRGGEELMDLAAHEIPFEVVPGVTSAFAVPAYNGIPVTHRDYAASVHVITGHRKQGQKNEINYRALKEAGGTLIFLMGVHTLEELCEGLLSAGMAPETEAAVLEKGTTAGQKRAVSCLANIVGECQKKKINPPAIFVVGPVCSLEKQLSWYENKSLFGVKVMLTAPEGRNEEVRMLLYERGAEVIKRPMIQIRQRESKTQLLASFEQLKKGAYEGLVFTSRQAVRIFMKELFAVYDARLLAGLRIAVIGPGTEKELREFGIRADLVPDVYDGTALGQMLVQQFASGSRLLLPRAAGGNAQLIEIAESAGLEITDLPLYETLPLPLTESERQNFAAQAPDCVIFTSASGVRAFAESLPQTPLFNCNAVCIGKQTQQAAIECGMKAYAAKEATPLALTECVEELVYGNEKSTPCD